MTTVVVMAPTAAPAPLTFANLRDIFNTRFKGGELEYGMRDYYINSAYRNLLNEANLAPEHAQSQIALTALSRTVPLPSGVFEVFAVRDVTNKNALVPIDGHRVPVDEYPDIETSPGTPESYHVRGNLLEIYPLSESAVTLEVTYPQEAPQLSAPGDLPILPVRYRASLVDGALALAYIDDQKGEIASLCQEVFNNALRQARNEFAGATSERYPAIHDDFYGEDG